MFKQLDRYIARNVLSAMLVVQLLILGLDFIITYINDLSDVEGDYGAFQVLLYLLIRLPYRFYEYAPVGVLLGALLGLGAMASSNELTIMRAAGWSLVRIIWGAGDEEAPHVLVGKGITFDSGGISLKPGPEIKPCRAGL